MERRIAEVKRKVAAAERIAVLTGAGVSAESGVPTFRGEDGLWKNHRAEELATPEAFAHDPRTVWEWYDWRRSLVAECQPNPAHEALARLERERGGGFTLVTQNVDGLHALAGSSDPVEMHGNIWKTRCIACHRVREDRRVPIPIPPVCNDCGAMLRPHIVWFGESLEEAVLARAFGAFEYCDVALIIGTSGMVQPAASLAGIARRHGAYVVEVNPELTPVSDTMDAVLSGKAAEVVPKLVPD